MIETPATSAVNMDVPLTRRNGLLQSTAEMLLIVALSVVTFWKSLRVPFLAGDYDWLSIGKFGQEEYYSALRQPFHLYRSVAGELFRWVYGFFGDESAFSYRLVLLTIHVVNAFLAGKLVARLIGRPSSAWITASIFAIAPASGEVIHSIAAFVYPIVALLLIVGLTFYDRAVQSGKVLPWALAMVCFGLAIPFREHALAVFPLAFLIEWLRGNGLKVLKTRGPWLRLLTPAVLGAAFSLFYGRDWALRIPSSPDYQLTISMGERLLVTLQRLVLPPVPLSYHDYSTIHKIIGLVFLLAIGVMIFTAPRGDRRRGAMLLLAVMIALAPFLPVEGDHVRQRFAYFGTVFAAGLVTFAVAVAAERFTQRVTLPIVFAILVGLLLEQQAEFERDYLAQSQEAEARALAYRDGGRLVMQGDDIAVFAGDLAPNIVSARSTLRVVTGLQRRQLILVKARNADDLVAEVQRIRDSSGAQGMLRLYVRGPHGYDRLRITEAADGIRRIFESGEPETERSIFVLVPRLPGAESR